MISILENATYVIIYSSDHIIFELSVCVYACVCVRMEMVENVPSPNIEEKEIETKKKCQKYIITTFRHRK